MTGGTDFTFRVTPKAFEEAAADMEKKTAAFTAAYEAMRQRVLHTAGYWKGSAGEAFRELFLETEDEMDLILKRLREHPGNLRTMAGIYQKAESDAAAAGNAVSSDLIS